MQALLEHFTVVIFIVCLAVIVISSIVLSTALDRVGAWLRFSAGLLGILTALGTDSPEISSAITALTSGNVKSVSAWSSARTSLISPHCWA